MNPINEIKKRILDLAIERGEGHIPSAWSIVGSCLHLKETMAPDDVFVLSKGHARLALDVIWGDPLPPNIHCAAGSLGHGLPFAYGIALAKKIKRESGKVYCIIGDGEAEEGSIYEARSLCMVINAFVDWTIDNNEHRDTRYLLNDDSESKGYPSKIMMAEPIKWHHRIPNESEYQEIIKDLS